MPERDRVRRKLEAQRKFRGDLAAYVAINVFLVVVWLATGRGYFWPGWVIGGWGVLLALHGWDLYLRRPITDADVDKELRRWRS
jgi:hypothetical protein